MFLASEGWTVRAQAPTATRVTLVGTKTQSVVRCFAPRRINVLLRSTPRSCVAEFRFGVGFWYAALLGIVTLAPPLAIGIAPLQQRAPSFAEFFALLCSSFLLLAWVCRAECREVVLRYAEHLHTAGTLPSGRTTMLFDVASPALFITGIILTLSSSVSVLLADHELPSFLTKGLPLSCLLLLLLFLALMITQAGRRRFRFHLPYFAGSVAVAIYCVWPMMSEATGIRERSLLFAVILAGTAFLLWIAATSLAEVTDHRHTTYGKTTDAPETTTRAYPLIVAVLTIWATMAYLQAHAIIWAARLFLHPAHPPVLVNIVWACILAAAYLILGVRALHRMIILRRETNAASPEQRDTVQRLAAHLRTPTPRVATSTTGVSHAQRHLVLGPALSLSDDVDALPPDQRDALILHELAHLKLHSRSLAFLELLASFTLCGHGVISMLIDSRQLEFEADQAAAEALCSSGLPGYALMQRVIVRRAKPRHGVGPERQRWPLEALFFGDTALWYRHPSLVERTRALEREVPCPR